MARIKAVPSTQAGPYVKIGYYFTRRALGRVTGRQTDRMIEPLQLYAHLPALFKGLRQARTRHLQAAPPGHQTAPHRRAQSATLAHCECCIDMGSAISLRLGLTDEEILALPDYQTSPLFSELDKLVFDYAVGMSRTPAAVPGELFDRFRQHLDAA